MKKFVIRLDKETLTMKATNDIAKYDKEVQQGIIRAIERGTNAVRATAIMKAPMGATGTLKAGIHADMIPGKPVGIVSSDAKHSHLIEFGTQPRLTGLKPWKGKKALRIPQKDGNYGFVKGVISSGRMPKKPFMGPAAEQERARIEAEIERAIKNDHH